MDNPAAPLVFSTSRIGLGAIRTGDAAEMALAGGTRVSTPLIGHFAKFGIPIATGVMALVSLWDHRIEKKRITRDFDDEIGLRVGKPAASVTVDDMEKVAKVNPVIGQALEKSKRQRNLSVGVVIAGGIAAVALVALAAPVIATFLTAHVAGGVAASAAGAIGHGLTGAHLIELAASGLSAGLGFLAVEKPLGKWGEKKMGLSEPGFDEVRRNPALQAKLSASSQITYLSEQQAKGKRISQAQVATVLVSANPTLARTGIPNQALSDLTDDINHHHMRVQELAFAAHGQSSGMQSLGDIQRANARMSQRVRQLEAQLAQKYASPAPDRVIALEEPQRNLWQQRELTRRQLIAKAQGVTA